MDNTTVTECEFHVGDWVVITDGVKECSYGCNSEMERLIGRVCMVTRVEHKPRSGYRDRRPANFRILLDTESSGGWTYDEGCIELACIEDERRVFETADISALFT